MMIQRFENLVVFLLLSIVTHTLYGFNPILPLRTCTRHTFHLKPYTYPTLPKQTIQKLHVTNKKNSNSESTSQQQQEEEEEDEAATTAAASSITKNTKNDSLTFDEAQQAIREQEDQSRMEARGLDLDQDSARMEANKSNFDRMREQIRSRAKDLNVSKSVATVDAIKQATARAMNPSDTPTLDLSKIGGDLLDTSDEDELPEDVKRELDKVGQLPFWEQAMEEFKNTRFPSMDATLKQAILMIVIFAVTASIILKVDEWLRLLYTSWGFIPKSGEILDFSNLALPEGFTDQMTDVDVSKM